MSLTKPQHPVRVLIVAAVVLVCANLAFLAGHSMVNGPAAVQRPVALVDLQPSEGQLLLPQGMVGAQVRTDFRAQLSIDGRVIPDDEISGDPNLGQFYFEPGPGREFREFQKGAHHADVQWWPKTIPSIEDAVAQQRVGNYSWAFNVG